MSEAGFKLALMAQAIANLLRIGKVVAVGDDHEHACVSFAEGQRTALLPVFQAAASEVKDHTPIAVGEQVMVLSPGGDTTCGRILRGLHGGGNAAPSTSGTEDTRTYPDGTTIAYDWAARRLTIDVKGAADIKVMGALDIKCQGPTTVTSTGPLTMMGQTIAMSGAGGDACPATLVGNFAMRGTLTVDGDISATGTIMDGGGNSNHHTH